MYKLGGNKKQFPGRQRKICSLNEYNQVLSMIALIKTMEVQNVCQIPWLDLKMLKKLVRFKKKKRKKNGSFINKRSWKSTKRFDGS